MKRDYRVYLRDILENMKTVEDFLKDITLEGLPKDRKTTYAVVRCIEIIGEVTKHIPNSIRKRYPDISWKSMAGMRDKVIHEYLGVVLEMIWKTVKKIPKSDLN